MRIDRPIGIWLLLLPSLWSIALASGGIQNFNILTLKTVLLFTLGAIIMRGAGCVINDLWDRDLDKKVERTRARPLAAGDITPKRAGLFLAALLFMGLIILLQFNVLTIVLGILTLPLIAIYPAMKRVTNYPQFVLGLTFNFGALMGWTAVTGTLDTPAILLYCAGILWTIGYDTIYAHQDIEDDAVIGVKSTALIWKENSKKIVSLLYILTIGALFFAFLLKHDLTAELALLCAPGYHLARQIKTWNEDSQESALKTFKSNQITGLIILILCLI